MVFETIVFFFAVVGLYLTLQTLFNRPMTNEQIQRSVVEKTLEKAKADNEKYGRDAAYWQKIAEEERNGIRRIFVDGVEQGQIISIPCRETTNPETGTKTYFLGDGAFSNNDKS